MSSPVTQITPNVTLFLPSTPAGGMKALGQSVSDLLRDLGLPVHSTADISAEASRFLTNGPEVLVTLHSAPMDAKLTDDCERPEYGQALDQYALRKLELHRAVIGITVEDHRSKAEARNRQSLALTLRLARGLVGETGADLVLWEQTRVLYTVGEFSGLGQPSRQRRPLSAQRSAPQSAPRAQMTGADAALAAAVPSLGGALKDAAETPEAQAEGLRRRVEDLAAPLHAEALRREGALPASESADEIDAALAQLHEPQSVQRPRPPARLTVALRWFGRQFDTWLEDDGMPSVKMQISVYTMTALTALISPPIGIALAAYNFLRRESLKVTVPVLIAAAAAQAAGLLDPAIATIRSYLG